jgi:dolichol-phosphate mannosyltransferase
MTIPKRDRILAILPAYNEEGKIGRVVEKVRRIELVESVVAIDDCSTDATSREAGRAGALVIRHEKNRGVGAAIRTGIKYGLEHDFDICVILSGDDQHEPEEIERVVGPILSGEYDFIQGSRWMKGGKVVSTRPFRKFATRLFSFFFTMAALRKVTDATNGFRAFRLSILDNKDINLDQAWLDRYELEPYILYKVIRNRRLRIREVPITIYYHQSRSQFTKMKPIRDWWRIAKPIIYLSLKLRK